jgi:3-methyladenine DNA glycosylase AlkD
MTSAEVISRLKRMANPRNVEGMARFGIATRGTLGISIYALRPLAREIGVDHRLAGQLWASGIHEARILAGFIEDPARITDAQMERWVRDFDSWDVCDQVTEAFARTARVRQKIRQWAVREEEFVKRAAFAMIAELAWHDKAASDESFEPFFTLIKRGAPDDRNYVKKAVNWALRNIGKRNRALNRRAVAVARELASAPSPAARWVASDALRELTGPAVQARLRAPGRPSSPPARPPRARRTRSPRTRTPRSSRPRRTRSPRTRRA